MCVTIHYLLATGVLFSTVPSHLPLRRGIAAAWPDALVWLLPCVTEVVGVHVLLRRGGIGAAGPRALARPLPRVLVVVGVSTFFFNAAVSEPPVRHRLGFNDWRGEPLPRVTEQPQHAAAIRLTYRYHMVAVLATIPVPVRPAAGSTRSDRR